MINRLYLSGITAALRDAGLIEIDNFPGVVEKVAADVASAAGAPPPSPQVTPPGYGIADQASPLEAMQLEQAGLTDKDVESAAKVVQVVAEMKQKAMAAQTQGAQAAPQGQPPLPPPPQAPQGAMPQTPAQPAQ